MPIPAGLSSRLLALANRQPPPEVLACTRTLDLQTLRYEFERAIAANEEDAFKALQRFNRRRGEAMARMGLGSATHLFTFWNDGGRLRHVARDRGVTVVSDVVIAPSTARIVRDEHRDFPEWGRAPLYARAQEGVSAWAAEEVLATTDRFLCPSSFVLDDLTNKWGVPREATRLSPYAISDAWFLVRPDTIPGRVLFVGTADLRKGIHYLAMAAELLQQRGKRYDVRVVGEVSDSVRSQPVCNAISFVGRVARSEVQNEFAKADVFVLPSLAEGSATVTYEALASGLPVVTTWSSGSGVRDGIEGCIVPERNPEALAMAIERIVDDRARRTEMAAAARVRAMDFTWKAFGERLIAATID